MADFTADCNFTETDTFALTTVAGFIARIGKVHPLAIDIGDTNSDTLDLLSRNRRLDALIIHGPAALDGTVTLQVSLDGENFLPLQSAGTNVTIAITEGTIVTALPPCHIRFVSDAAESAVRVISVLAIPAAGV